MKKFLQDKKFIIIASIALLIIIAGISCIFLFSGKDNKEKDNKVLKEEEYVAYVKINPLVKLTFKSSYYECKDKNGKVNICGEYTNEVTKAELLNDDAKSIYQDLDFKGKTLSDVMCLLIVTAWDNDFNIENINVTSDWNYDIDNINKMVAEKIKADTSVEVEIKFNYQKNIDEKSILENEDIKNYIVSFDSAGGTNIDKKYVAENKTVEKPSNPTKDGYVFVEWQLDGTAYDFNSKVNKDITLKAKWKSNSNNTNSNTDNNQIQTSTKEQDNAILRKQLQEKGLQWDFNTEEEAWQVAWRWTEKGGYIGDVVTSSYGNSDIAYSVRVTLNTSSCNSNKIIDIDWHNPTPAMDDFIYYLHSLGYNCSGNIGYYNGKLFKINENNELVYEE